MSSDDFIPDRERAAAADAQIPIIDISPFAAGGAGKRGVVNAIAQACEQVGFFGIVGHGFDDAKIEAIYREGRAFFVRVAADHAAVADRHRSGLEDANRLPDATGVRARREV